MRRKTLKSTALKGLAVLLPSLILVTFLLWIWRVLFGFVRPAGALVASRLGIGVNWGAVIVLIVFIVACYSLGHAVTTAVGRKVKELVEKNFFDRAPGYALVRNVVSQLLGTEKSPLSSFSVVRFEEAGIRMSGFAVERSEDGWCTIFVPTAPNPTSGFILHVREERVMELNVSPGEAIESVIGCGAGSATFHQKCAERDSSPP